MPSMLTRPAPISSAACCRERASPRRTNSASTRARRVTWITAGSRRALLDRFQRMHQQVVRLLQPGRHGVDVGSATSVPSAGSGNSASNSAIWARISSGSVLMSVFTLVDRRTSAGTSAPWPVGPCRRPRRSRTGWPSRSAVPDRVGGRPDHRQRSPGSLAGDCTVTAAAPISTCHAGCGPTRRVSARRRARAGLRRCSRAAARGSARTVSARC